MPGRWALRSGNVMQSNEEGQSAKQHLESMGVGRLQMVSWHRRGTAVTVGMGVECLRRSGIQNE
jgi:hypothetical protein